MRTAPHQKTAISIPADVLAAADRIARRRGKSRSAFISEVLRAAVRAQRDADVTRKLDELFSDPGVQEVQRRDARQLDDAGTEWSDERW